MTKPTFVSALFNIDRVDGRKWDQYLKWFEETLKLQVPMVLFIEKELQDFIDEKRGDLPTQTIYQTIEDIPYYNLKDKIQGILDSDEYKEKMSDTDRIECKQAMYSVIQYSKFPWLQQAIELNPHKSDIFFWLDAGGSRFFNNFDLTEPYPGTAAMESLEGMGESFLIQMNCEYYRDLYEAKELDESYLYDNRSYVLGSMFGGHKNSVPKICDMVDNIFQQEMIAKGNVNNEQIALGYLVKKYPDDFAVYTRTNGQHMDLFTTLID
ncbi:MAG: WlaTC/HtrL family glycosyltransferase [Pseudomonadota bacterium]|nr:WlaTC/HtrL family glycosyltransferase [Pseudomonadota bacterium]